MKSIKTIYTFGSSCTAGGGFEFDSPHIHQDFPTLYSYLDEEQTPFNFSWPGQLQKLLGNKVKVENLAKAGRGNERTERLLYNIINSKDFNKNETLFLLEITATGRDELFSIDLNDYVVLNYNFLRDGFSYTAAAKDYIYQTESDEKYLKSYDSLFETFIYKFKSINDEMEKLKRNVDFFLSYLDNKSINYLLSSPPPFFINYNENKLIEYGDGLHFQKSKCFIDFTYLNKITIKDETNGLSEDLHSGFKSNKLVANIVFNKLVENKLIDFDKKEIDWKYYKELKVIKKIL
jgi:hypothetical protein